MRAFASTAESRWLEPYIASRLTATALAWALVIWNGMSGGDLILLLYGPFSTAAAALRPDLRRCPTAWAIDSAAVLACILVYGDWRSPFYLLWLTTLALPAASVGRRRGVYLGLASSLAFLLIAVVGGPVWGGLHVISAETLAIHVALPLLLVPSLAYAADALRSLDNERAERERLAIEAERRRIAWDLHDSAKQRIHAAQLLVSSLEGRVPSDVAKTVGRAAIELESAASEMDTSLAELHSPLEGGLLHEALKTRAAELAPEGRPRIVVRGTAPPLSPLVGTHLFRVGSEAITNALRHADASAIEVTIDADEQRLRLCVRDDGRGLPADRRANGHGLPAIESRASTIGGRVEIGPATPSGGGTSIALEVPLTTHRGAA